MRLINLEIAFEIYTLADEALQLVMVAKGHRTYLEFYKKKSTIFLTENSIGVNYCLIVSKAVSHREIHFIRAAVLLSEHGHFSLNFSLHDVL